MLLQNSFGFMTVSIFRTDIQYLYLLVLVQTTDLLLYYDTVHQQLVYFAPFCYYVKVLFWCSLYSLGISGHIQAFDRVNDILLSLSASISILKP